MKWLRSRIATISRFSAKTDSMEVRINAITPEERTGAGLEIDYGFARTRLGEMLVASTDKGICRMVFADDRAASLAELGRLFPRAALRERSRPSHARALAFFDPLEESGVVDLHIGGTPFQMEVWKALLGISRGELSTYGKIAAKLGLPRASRAVGAAVGRNPVAGIIPCHRVVRADGALGGYMWGPERKAAILQWEKLRR
jgi:AraC family transcriptional regulator of adaptative response/methylated-DNA-[protein]-cysteine methyltransferase